MEKDATPEAWKRSGFFLFYVVSADADAIPGPPHAPLGQDERLAFIMEIIVGN